MGFIKGYVGQERWPHWALEVVWSRGGWSAFYRWQSSRSIAEVSGSVPRHAMWGSDGRVKRRGGLVLLTAGKGNMNSIFVRRLTLLGAGLGLDISVFIFVLLHYTLTLLLCFFSYLAYWKKLLWFVGCCHTDTGHCRPASRTTEVLRIWKRPPVTSERLI